MTDFIAALIIAIPRKPAAADPVGYRRDVASVLVSPSQKFAARAILGFAAGRRIILASPPRHENAYRLIVILFVVISNHIDEFILIFRTLKGPLAFLAFFPVIARKILALAGIEQKASAGGLRMRKIPDVGIISRSARIKFIDPLLPNSHRLHVRSLGIPGFPIIPPDHLVALVRLIHFGLVNRNVVLRFVNGFFRVSLLDLGQLVRRLGRLVIGDAIFGGIIRDGVCGQVIFNVIFTLKMLQIIFCLVISDVLYFVKIFDVFDLFVVRDVLHFFVVRDVLHFFVVRDALHFFVVRDVLDFFKMGDVHEFRIIGDRARTVAGIDEQARTVAAIRACSCFAGFRSSVGGLRFGLIPSPGRLDFAFPVCFATGVASVAGALFRRS